MNKEQKTVKEENLFDSANIELNCHYKAVDGMASFENKEGTNAVTIRLDGSSKVIKLAYDVAPGTYSDIFVDSNNSILHSGTLNNDELSYLLNVPAKAALLVINYGNHAVPSIYRAG